MLIHLPILQVILPLVAAPSCLIIRHARFAWGFALVVCAAAFAVSLLLLQQVLADGTISYTLGGWDAPWGIEYRIDILNAWVLAIVSGISFLVLAGSRESVRAEIGERRQTLFYTLYLLCFAGLLGIVATGDAFNVFVFLEISSLATYAMIALGRDRRALWSAFQYLVLGTIGATFILIGIGFLYMMTGTLNMLDLGARLPALSESTTVVAALVFILVGVCLKLALFPLHAWLPGAYSQAPSIVTAFLAATATKVALYLLLRFTFTVFGLDLSLAALPLQVTLIAFGLAGVLFASLIAVYQSDIKRMLAYSSVAQMGYLVTAVALGNVLGLQAALLHLFNHALMKAALFLALAGVVLHFGSTLTAIRGLGRSMPWTAAALVVAGMSLVGMPLTAGFISKWYLVSASIDAGLWWVAGIIVIGSLLAAVYVWRIVEALYAQDGEAATISAKREAPAGLLIPVWILALANIYFGIDTELPLQVTAQAARFLMGEGF